ncbi:TatD family hydrolase [Paraneptunicella aestuarii]|uniref:TatD family hydrolase n=1 Tax=Paraneptunicella aestuarii TaxID=2831148 RepID=UPI001E5CA517|nr:TatD family hydrolase [Paraneptunicella aestuarii]UAA40077.1 TatD family hydrolase [Paraneptunicella aestuarii]
MIDSHCHLDFDCFDSDREPLLKRCKEQDVERIFIPGTQVAHFYKLLEIQQQYSNQSIYPQIDIALGLHPYFLSEHYEHDLKVLEKTIVMHRDKLVAVGEIGLDFSLRGSLSEKVSKDIQERVFQAQLNIAKRFQLPVILHHRKSHNELIRILKQSGFDLGGIIHAFSGSLQIAEQYIELGFKLGVGGTITYPRARKTRETIKHISLEYLVLETDAPDMPIYGRQGERNSPEYLPEIVMSLAELKGESAETVIASCSNSYREAMSL